MFVRHSTDDSAEAVFRRTVLAAAGFLWVLGVPEQALAALYDLIASVSGEEGLRAALAARLGEHPDALA